MDINRLKAIMVAEGIDISGTNFVRAFRKFENPAGCEACGARTKLAEDHPKKKNTLRLKCCGLEFKTG